ncbi:DUF6192 family protein [Streptomyces sp. CA-132043]|uniref:DUF6192 family protein n=1 Tax=Streptomyces sp. CA-132043 TaxID=3240048 RepID=UPI003D90936A
MENSSFAPVLRSVNKTLQFQDFKKACHQFLLATHDLVPALQDEDLDDDVTPLTEQHLARLRAACGWGAHALATGEIDKDEELVRLLHDNDDSGADEEDGDDDEEGSAGVRT